MAADLSIPLDTLSNALSGATATIGDLSDRLLAIEPATAET